MRGAGRMGSASGLKVVRRLAPTTTPITRWGREMTAQIGIGRGVPHVIPVKARVMGWHFFRFRRRNGFSDRFLLLLLRQDAAQTGAPCGAASGRGKSPKGGAQDAPQFAARTGTCAQRTPEPARAPGGQDARKARHRGCVSLVTFFAQAKKV